MPLSCAISLTLDSLSCCRHLLLVPLQWTKCWALPGATCWKDCPLGPISRRLCGTNRPPQHIASKVSLVTSRTTGCTWRCLRQEKRRQLMGVPLHSFLTYLYLACGLPTGSTDNIPLGRRGGLEGRREGGNCQTLFPSFRPCSEQQRHCGRVQLQSLMCSISRLS